MLQLRFLLISLFLIGMWSCQSGSEQQENEEYTKYYDSVMMIHDRTMPFMNTIDQLRQQIKEKKDALENGSESEVMDLNQLLGELNKGEDAMYDWMHNFKPDSIQEDEKLQYIQNELHSIRRMEEIMMNGIHQAEEFLGSE